MKSTVATFVILLLFAACKSKKDTTYTWKGEDESRTLTLLKNGTFVLDIQGGYYNRLDTGTYQLRGDTLVINPDKVRHEVDSIAAIDSLFNGQRFIEVFQEEVEVDTANAILGYSYREVLFPQVEVNGAMTLSVSPDDSGYHKLILPDSVTVKKMKIVIREDNTCKPFITFFAELPADKQSAKSYQLYIPSSENRDNYLGGFHWLIKNDTIESFFSSDSCESTEIKMVKK